MSINANFCAFAVIAATASRHTVIIFFISILSKQLFDVRKTFRFILPIFNISKTLELLTEDEVELTATLCTEDLIETVGPVDTHQTDHREEDTYTNTC